MPVYHPARIILDSDAFARMETAAHEAATSNANSRKPPSVEQAVANNYKKGPGEIHGLRIKIDNPRGTFRTGTSEDGTEWANRVAAHYGDITGTKGADGDAVDIFLGLFPESKKLWVINQRKTWGDGDFDEHKVMAAFATEKQAVDAYLNSYDRGWNGLESIVPCTYAQLKWWLKNGDCTQRFTADSLPFDEGTAVMDNVQWNSEAEPIGLPMHRLMYDLRREDTGGLLLDAATMQELMGDPDIEGLMVLDALVVQVNKMTIKMDRLKAIMEAAGNTVKPTEVTISDPVRARGVLQVMVLFQMSDGQTISIWFHNPDTTPAKLTPMDELISWKWLLNKKDVTIVVAPEHGKDLNVREVARRVMRLVERNSEAFARANSKAAERSAQTESLKAEIGQLEGELTGLQKQIAIAKVQVEDKPNAWRGAAPAFQMRDGKMVITDWESGDVISDFSGVAYDYAKSHFVLTEIENGERTFNVLTAKTYAEALPEAEALKERHAALAEEARSAKDKAAGKSLVMGFIADHGGELGAWGYSRADGNGGPENAVLKINGVDVYLTAGVDGVVLVNGKPSDPSQRLNVTAEALEASILAVAPVPEDVRLAREAAVAGAAAFSVRRTAEDSVLTECGATPEDIASIANDGGYGAIVADQALSLKWQDVLDSLFAERIVQVRNALRELDWGGKGTILTKAFDQSVHGLGYDTKQVGAGGNIVGMTWLVDAGTSKIVDDLTLKAAPMAAQIDATAAPKAEASAPAPTITAYEQGKADFASGFKRIPAQSVGLAELLKGSGNGAAALTDDYLRGWDEANLSVPLPAVEQTPAQKVDAAYLFADATEAFKLDVALSIEEIDYSPFVSAKAIDQRAKELGLNVSWDVTMAVLDGIMVSPEALLDDAGDGAYMGKPKDAIVATAKLLKYFRDFIRSDKDLAKDPTDKWGTSIMNKADAQRILSQLIDIAVNRKAGATLTVQQEDDYADFVHDARVINDFLHNRIRNSGSRNLLRNAKMKALYPDIDNQPLFDDVASLATPYLSMGAALVSAPPPLADAEWPSSWLDFKVVDQTFVDQQGAMILPSERRLSGSVNIVLADNDSAVKPFYVAGRIVGVSFTADKVRYSVAVPIAPQPKEGVTLYAVIHGIDSSIVMSNPLDEYQLSGALDGVTDTLSEALRGIGSVEAAKPIFDFVGQVPAAVSQLQIALDVVTTNEPINRERGDVAQADLERDNAVQFRRAIDILNGKVEPLFDDAGDGDSGNEYQIIVGTIKRGADVLGRAMIGGDGKAMIYLGASGTQRVTYISQADGQRRSSMWSEDDTGELVDHLVENTSGVSGQPPAPPPVPEPVLADPPEPSKATEAEGRAALRAIADFMPRSQRKAIELGMAGEEAQYFFDKMVEMRTVIETMPVTYQTDNMGGKAVACLHYFRASGDWWITEKDSEPEQQQAFGLADLGQGSELGYISIIELVQNGVELDLHWEPKTLDAIRGKADAPAAAADPVQFQLIADSYEAAKLIKTQAEDQEDRFGAVLKAFPTGAMGLTPDDVKASAEWKLAYSQHAAAFAELRRVNEWFTKTYAKEYAAERDAKRTATQYGADMVSAYVTASGKEAMVIKASTKDGVTRYSYNGQYGAGSGHLYAEMANEVRIAKQAHPGMKLFAGREFSELEPAKVETVNNDHKLDYPTWEDAVTTLVASLSGATRSDAQGMVEAKEALMQAQYAANAEPSAVAALIVTPAAAPAAPAEPPAVAQAPAPDQGLSDYDQWLSDIYAAVEAQGAMNRSDAQGMVDAQDFVLTQSWGLGLKPEAVAAKLLGKEAPAAEPAPPPGGPAIEPDDVAYLLTLITGTADMLDPAILERIEPMFEKYKDSPEMIDTLNKAAEAYSAAAVAAAKATLAG